MTLTAGMFLVGAHVSRELNHAVSRALGRSSGAGFKRNVMTVKAAQMLLLAYAMRHTAQRDIALYSRMRM